MRGDALCEPRARWWRRHERPWGHLSQSSLPPPTDPPHPSLPSNWRAIPSFGWGRRRQRRAGNGKSNALRDPSSSQSAPGPTAGRRRREKGSVASSYDRADPDLASFPRRDVGNAARRLLLDREVDPEFDWGRDGRRVLNFNFEFKFNTSRHILGIHVQFIASQLDYLSMPSRKRNQGKVRRAKAPSTALVQRIKHNDEAWRFPRGCDGCRHSRPECPPAGHPVPRVSRHVRRDAGRHATCRRGNEECTRGASRCSDQ